MTPVFQILYLLRFGVSECFRSVFEGPPQYPLKSLKVLGRASRWRWNRARPPWTHPNPWVLIHLTTLLGLEMTIGPPISWVHWWSCLIVIIMEKAWLHNRQIADDQQQFSTWSTTHCTRLPSSFRDDFEFWNGWKLLVYPSYVSQSLAHSSIIRSLNTMIHKEHYFFLQKAWAGSKWLYFGWKQIPYIGWNYPTYKLLVRITAHFPGQARLAPNLEL